jgi:hypothetical protein
VNSNICFTFGVLERTNDQNKHHMKAIMTKATTAKATTFTYQTAKGLNVETFEGCHITLMRDGLFVYENWFSSLMMPFYIQQLEEELIKRGIEYTKEEK